MVETVQPDQIKEFYNNRKSHKVYTHHDDYFEQENLSDELDEFISYHDIKTEFSQYQSQYNASAPCWSSMQQSERTMVIQQAINQLDLDDRTIQLKATQQLMYIALGNYDDCSPETHGDQMAENNRLLYQSNIITTLKQVLTTSCQQIETTENDLTFHCHQMDMYLTLLFLVIQFNQASIQTNDEELLEFLLDLLVYLKDHFIKAFPIKKLVMTVHKLLLIVLGPLDETYQEIKSAIRAAYQLPPIHSSSVKLTPEELHQYYQQTQQKYPTFTPTPLPATVANPLSSTSCPQLTQLIGLTKAAHQTDLPYHTLFPSKNNNNSQPTHVKKASPENVNSVAFTPYSLTEANHVWLDHLYLSVSDYQLIQARERAIHRSDRLETIPNGLDPAMATKMARIDRLFAHTVADFQSMVVVILKLLLSTVSVGKETDLLEDINVTRHRESVSKAVTGILLLLLKWFKVSHVLKFEYLSQILVDSGCMLLVLKLLGLQEIALLASKRTDDPSQSFSGFIHSTPSNDDDDDDDDDHDVAYTNKRNVAWSIHLLRILQLLTKRKAHRILLLVQYKSSAILKKLLKVGHPTMDLYVLKNLKNQIPFMGRKWRSNNMKTISAIYAHFLTRLNDDWLSSQEGTHPTEESAAKEISLRVLTRLYLGQHYLPQLMPVMDDLDGPDSTLFYNRPTEEDEMGTIELETDFKEGYRDWLESNVYSTTDDEQQEEEETGGMCTPFPDQTTTETVSPDALAKEINKLYLEELDREFKQKQQLETDVSDGWDQPIQPVKKPATTTTTTATITADEEDDEDDEDEWTQETDPLGDIDWESLTEEDLKRRLTMVEEKTVQRWMNVDVDDPRYLKVLNAFEGEIPLDEEGWPIW